MKTKALIFSILVLTQSICEANSAEKEKHGGDACMQAAVEADKTSMQNVGRQIDVLNLYPEINWDVYLWFWKNSTMTMVPQTFVDGVETDARSDRGTRTIEISRSRFCSLSPQRQQAILFHEVLVIAGYEETNYYRISSRYIPNLGRAEQVIGELKEQIRELERKQEEARRNQGRWTCMITAYSGSDYFWPKQGYRYSGTGPNPEDAFYAAVESMGGLRWNMCHKYERIDNYSDRVRCTEEATPLNSCIQNF